MPTATIQSPATGSTITFAIYEGQILPQQTIGDVYSRLGGAGEGVQTLGSVGPDCDITAYFLTNSLQQAQSAQIALAALINQYVSVIEPDGVYWQRVLVKKMIARRRRGRHGYNGVLYAYRVSADMTLSTQL